MSLPGVGSMAWTSGLPLRASVDQGRLLFDIVGDAPPDKSRRPSTTIRSSVPRTSGCSTSPSSPAAASTTTIRRTACRSDRERSVRSRAPAGPIDHRGADRVAAAGHAAGQARNQGNRGRRPAGQGTARRVGGSRSVLCPLRAAPGRRHLHGGPAGGRARRSNRTLCPRRHRKDRQGTARQRA